MVIERRGEKRIFFTSLAISLALQIPLTKSVAALDRPARIVGQIGLPARAYPISLVESEGKTRLVVETNSVVVPLDHVTQFQVETVEVASGGKVAIARLFSSAGEQAAAIITKPRSGVEIAWIRKLGLTGDPGERVGDVLDVRDRNGDNKPEIVVGRVRENVRMCGEDKTFLYPKTIDANSLKLVPVNLNRPSSTGSHPVIATRESPGPPDTPLVKTLSFIAASSQLGADQVDPLQPAALTDGVASTLWIEEGVTKDSGEFITARREAAAWPIKAIAFTFSPNDREFAARFARPKRFWIVGENKQQVEVLFPEDPLQFPGQRFWVVPEKPLSGSCLSIILDENFPATGDVNAPAAIAEVEAYTDLDFGDGLARLVEEIARDTALGSDAVPVLVEIGEPAVEPISRAWGRMSPQGHRRAIRVFAALAKTVGPARNALLVAARNGDDAVRKEAIKALASAGVAASKELMSLVAEQGPLGDEAALAFASAAPQQATAALLDAIEWKGRTERPLLRKAIAKAVEASGDQGVALFVDWLKKDRSTEALTSVALALSRVSNTRSVVEELIEKLITRVEMFQARWRLVQAIAWLPTRPVLDQWLAKLAKNDERWMIRAAALRTLRQRQAPGNIELFKESIKDKYPRVRAMALAGLADDTNAIGLIAAAARSDGWPLVRAAAMEALGETRAEVSALIEGVSDPAKVVRSTAIRALTKRREPQAWSVIEKRLQDMNEWPEVTYEAILFSKSLCIPGAAKHLERIVERGLKDKAWLADIDSAAIALETLGYIRGPQAIETIRAASLPVAPAALQAAAKTAAKYRTPCSPKD